MSGSDDWGEAVDELHRREALAHEMGGADKIERQHAGGKLTVRERIDALVDPGSFHEIGALAGKATYAEDGSLDTFTPSNFVMGRARIDGRTVVVGGDDFTVRGGAADAAIWQKQVYAEQMAHELRLPIVRLVDGTGGGGSVKSLETERRTYVPPLLGWQHTIDNLAQVPVVALALGSVAGLGAARVVNSHYSLMVRDTSQVFVAGPPVVARVEAAVTKEELGGDHIHGRNGVVDDVVDSEADAFARTRRFLSYLPSSVHATPPRAEPTDDADRADEWLLSAIPRSPRQVYKIRPIVETLVDAGSWLEIGAGWGRAAVCGLARLDGWPVAVLASDPYQAGGSWTADASDKVTRFVDLADTFHLPVVHLVDQPGFMVGVAGEQAGTIRHGVRAVAAIHQATVPWCSVLLRKVFGVGGAGHQSSARLSYRYAWPSGSWGSLPVEGGVEAAFRAELDALADEDARQARIAEITARMDSVRSPFRTAEAFLVEEIIDPRQTRRLLCEFAELAAPLRQPGITARTYRP